MVIEEDTDQFWEHQGSDRCPFETKVNIPWLTGKRKVLEIYGVFVGFEVFTAVTMKNGVFWDLMPCDSCKNRRFGGT
jgi:hypothetical protein